MNRRTLLKLLGLAPLAKFLPILSTPAATVVPSPPEPIAEGPQLVETVYDYNGNLVAEIYYDKEAAMPLDITQYQYEGHNDKSIL